MKSSIFTKFIFILFFPLIINCVSKGQENMRFNKDQEEIIWTTMNVWYKADSEKGKMGSYEETKFDFLGHDFVKNCSIEIKTIIAFYSTFIPNYLLIENANKNLAEALGNFLTIEDAQNILLKDKEKIFENARNKIEDKYIMYLKILLSTNEVCFEYGNKEADRYIIEDGNIILK